MGKVKGLFVIAAIVLGLLLMLLVGLTIRPDDGKQPTGDGASTSQFSGVSPPWASADAPNPSPACYACHARRS